MLGMLLAYDESGRVIATLDYMVHSDEEGNPVGIVDFEAVERAGVPLLDVWNVEGAKGSGTWPEWIGSAALEFRVERDPDSSHPIRELVHIGLPESVDHSGNRIPPKQGSGHRRRRDDVERMIAERISKAGGSPADIRDLVGGPDRPLLLDNEGRKAVRSTAPQRPKLPLASVGIPPNPPAGQSAEGNPSQSGSQPRARSGRSRTP